jgi:hypothetical protein
VLNQLIGAISMAVQFFLALFLSLCSLELIALLLTPAAVGSLAQTGAAASSVCPNLFTGFTGPDIKSITDMLVDHQMLKSISLDCQTRP